MTTEHHLILGTGPAGKAIMNELVKRGKTISMLNRSGKTDGIPAGVTLLKGNLTERDFLRGISAGKSHLYNCANPAYTNWATDFPPINDAVLDAVTHSKARLIMMDNLYMYGDTGGAPLTEGLPYNGHGKKPKLRAEMARKILDAHERGDIQAVIGRASDFVGEGVRESSLGELVFENAIKGKSLQFIGNIDMPHTYTYMGDIGVGMVNIALDEGAYGKAWHLPSPKTVTTRQWVDLISKKLGKPLKVQALSQVMVRLVGLFMPTVREFNEMYYEFSQPFVLDSSPYKARYGDHSTDMETIVDRTLAWYKAQTH